VIDQSPAEPARTGTWKARLDGYGSAHTDTVSQAVTLPASVGGARLSFWLHVDSLDTSTVAHDTLTVRVTAPDGATSTLATYSNADQAGGYTYRWFDLSSLARPYAGRPVTVTFTGTEDAAQQTSFLVDDTALAVTP
jgi:hypothetical protein